VCKLNVIIAVKKIKHKSSRDKNEIVHNMFFSVQINARGYHFSVTVLIVWTKKTKKRHVIYLYGMKNIHQIIYMGMFVQNVSTN
jgi:hypothetical protein